MINEEHIKTGAIPSPFDSRDYIYGEHLGMASSPFDWDNGYDIEKELGFKLPVKDQGRSNSCGGQAWSTYNAILECVRTKTFEEESAKFIFAHTHVGDSGSRGRDNCKLCADKGVSKESLCSSYENGLPPSNDFMIDLTSIRDEAFKDALKNKSVKAYSQVRHNIEDLAIAIRDNHGVVFGIYGNNNGTWTSKFPKAPTIPKDDCWAHWVYVGKVEIIKGVKYFGLLNSWGDDVGEDGWQYIKADDFINYLFEVWAFTILEDTKYVFQALMKFGSTGLPVKMLQIKLGIGVDGIFGRLTKNAVIQYQKEHNLTPDGIVGPLTRAVLNK